MLGMKNRKYMSKDTAKKVYEAYNKVYRTGKSMKVFGYELIRKDGKKRLVGVSISLARDSEKKLVGFRGIARDVTGLKPPP
jgi:PAS domain S-box-containing protein